MLLVAGSTGGAVRLSCSAVAAATASVAAPTTGSVLFAAAAAVACSVASKMSGVATEAPAESRVHACTHAWIHRVVCQHSEMDNKCLRANIKVFGSLQGCLKTQTCLRQCWQQQMGAPGPNMWSLGTCGSCQTCSQSPSLADSSYHCAGQGLNL